MPAATDIEILRTVVYSFTAILIVALIAFAVVGRVGFSKVERGGEIFRLTFYSW